MAAPALDTPALDVPALDVPALDVKGLNKSFNSLHVTRNVSFAVAPQTITAIVGPNGAGKTTLFNLITNLVRADAGEARLFGQALAGLTPAAIADRGLIRTFQTARVFPGQTALENVMVGHHRKMNVGPIAAALRLPASRKAEAELRERALTLLGKLGLARYAHMDAIDLPMGAQKLLEIGRALMAGPRVLLLDEPAAGLNDSETAELSEVLQAIRAGGVTVILVEHNMPLVMSVSDQVVVIDSGAVIALGPPETVQSDEKVIAAYLGAEVAA